MKDLTKNKNLQDKFLRDLIKKNTLTEINLLNGLILLGKISNFDNFSIEISEKKNNTLIYKHAIAYIQEKNKK